MAGNIGELKDLKPARIGNSGRAVRIQVIGSRASLELNGYRVINALGLKDTLFTLTREHNPDGSVSHFTFHGRGWGHGVGLCQIGAFGMAKAGRSYEEILKHYYQGVEIRKAY
jgi:stage II sporulation protein D